MSSALAARADGLPTLSLCLIARNEADSLPRLLRSIEGAFDEIVLVDTGSRDRTLAVFADWTAHEAERARAAGTQFHTVVDHFDWCDDFAAARRQADSLASGDFLVWADCDDKIVGAQNLRALAANAPPEVVALVAVYDYAHDEHGNVVCQLKRERLVRRGHGIWGGRVHEAQDLDGPVQHIPSNVASWEHAKVASAAAGSNARNLRILRKWIKDDPTNARALLYLGTEEQARYRHEPAIRWLKRAIRHMHGWDEQRAQTHRKLAQSLLAVGRPRDAIRCALEAVQVMPQWPDSYLTLAEAHYAQHELDKAIHHADRVLELGVPDTLLIIDPTQYTVQPHVILAGAHAAQGRVDQAIQHAERVLAAQPGHSSITGAYRDWLAIRKRESTADSFLACADLLLAHDEQLKALDVLRSVPYYAIDHPRVVALRSEIRERVDPLFTPAGYTDRYETGGSKPEDMTKDAEVMLLGDILPRCGFLLRGLRELAA